MTQQSRPGKFQPSETPNASQMGSINLPKDVACWDSGDLVKEAKERGDRLASEVWGDAAKREVGKTQVRAVLDELVGLRARLTGDIKADADLLRRRMPLLRPQFAYISSRHSALRPFLKDLDVLLERSHAHKEDDALFTRAFDNVSTFVESVVAYFCLAFESR